VAGGAVACDSGGRDDGDATTAVAAAADLAAPRGDGRG
jgi:hypothetical protein